MDWIAFGFLYFFELMILSFLFFLSKESKRMSYGKKITLNKTFIYLAFLITSIIFGYFLRPLIFNEVPIAFNSIMCAIIIIPIYYEKNVIFPLTIGYIIGSLILFSVQGKLYILISLALFVLIAIGIYWVCSINRIKRNYLKVIINTLILLFVMLIAAYLAVEYTDHSLFILITYDLIIWWSVFIASIFILSTSIFLINKLFDNYDEMNLLSSTQSNTYYKFLLFQTTIYKIVKEKKIEYGIMGVFNNNFSSHLTNDNKLEEIKNEFQKEIKNSLFFNINLRFSGFFIPITNKEEYKLFMDLRNKNDSYYEKIFRKSIIDEFGKKDNKSLALSFYGIDSNNFTELIENCFSYLTVKTNNKDFQIYKYESIKSNILFRKKIFDESKNIKKIKHQYSERFGVSKIVYPNTKIEINSSWLQMKDIYLNYPNENGEIVYRFILHKSIENFFTDKIYNHYKIAFYYDSNLFVNNQIDLQEFYNKLLSIGELKRIIIYLNTEIIDDEKLKDFKSLGINLRNIHSITEFYNKMELY